MAFNKLKMSDLKNLSDEELQDKAGHLKKELMQFRFQAKTGKLERQTSMRDTKRNIARIMTIISERKKVEVKA